MATDTPATASNTYKEQIRTIAALPTSFIVRIEGANAVAYNGLTGAVVSTSATHATAIQAALDAVSGTAHEKVVLIGSFTIAAQLTVSPYTTIEIQGTVTVTSGSFVSANGAVVYVGASVCVSIFGGMIDGNDKQDTINQNPPIIKTDGAVDFDLQGVRLDNAYTHCLSLNDTTYFSCTDCDMIGFGDDGISCLTSSYGTLSGNKIRLGSSATGGSSGIEVEDASHHITIGENVCTSATGASATGIKVVLDPGANFGASHDITIEGNVCDDNINSGITVASNDNAANSSIVQSGTAPFTYTVTTTTDHHLTVGDVVVIRGTDVADYHTAHVVDTVGSTTTYTFKNYANIANTATHGSTYNVIYNCVVGDNICTGNATNYNFTYIAGCTVNGNKSFDNTVYGITMTYVFDSVISDNSVNFSADIGINVAGDISGVAINDNTVFGAGDTGINLSTTTATGFSVQNNTVINCARLESLKAGMSVGGTQTKPIISGNTLLDTRTTKNMRGINIGGSITDAQVKNNVLNTAFYNPGSRMIQNAGTNSSISGNDGYITEKTSTGSITSGGTSDVITHGLTNYDTWLTAGMISVTLTENPTNSPGAIWVDNITATAFTVNCENDPGASNLDFEWSVRRH